ncbi:hypothetical protein CVD28_17760 [Bacillus sp. M6-12]|uniref:YpoC family protein n=1 Tax=Bacillus sp. M6-12 TaxID=2054166 RepID=UPI000C790035|nr:hypothetical protein [Bacillus sp. M6-12]PLS16317.1 hypothetical protein CVD28_17760 [Bacillus sp. M6-12]
MSQVHCKIPADLEHPLFYSSNELALEIDCFQVWDNLAEYAVYPYEILAANGNHAFQPWQESGQALPDLFAKWKTLSLEAGLLFAERNTKEAAGPMIEGLAIFISALFWMNGYPVTLSDWQGRLSGFDFKPVNAVERLEFVMNRPLLYHSYKQLTELMIELEKQYYKKIALQK